MANPNTREEKNAGQAARETARRISGETHQYAQAAADVGEGAVRTSTELLQRNSEMMQQFWEAARKMASQLSDPSVNPVFRAALGSSDEEAQNAAHQSARNVEAVLGSSTVVAQELQNMSREWLEFAQSRFQQTLSCMDSLGRCRTPQDAAAVQSELMRDTLERFLQSARRTAEMSARMADTATRRITENLNRDRPAA
jgi:hypothetical protein